MCSLPCCGWWWLDWNRRCGGRTAEVTISVTAPCEGDSHTPKSDCARVVTVPMPLLRLRLRLSFLGWVQFEATALTWVRLKLELLTTTEGIVTGRQHSIRNDLVLQPTYTPGSHPVLQGYITGVQVVFLG